MSRAICIPFHRYQPRTTQHYRVWENALANSIEYYKSEIDKLYLIDDDWEFTHEFLDSLGIDYEVIPKTREGHHWVQFKTAIPHIKEDYCLFLDNDVLFWKHGIVDGWFKEAGKGKFVTAWDGSGGLGEVMQEHFPVLKDNSAHRMGSYYFILNQEQMEIAKKEVLEPIYYSPGTKIPELHYKAIEGDWQDSFGVLTYKILSKNPETFTIEDDRSSIYCQDGGFKKDPEIPKRLGYYHVRNGNHSNYLLSSLYGGREDDYKHSVSITPRRELLRILAWHWLSTGDQFGPLEFLLMDLNVNLVTWFEYLDAFKEYHGI